MTPFEVVASRYTFPPHIVDHPLQIEVINDLSMLKEQGEWLDMGTGKTYCATNTALYLKIAYGHQTIIVMPPLLVPQWAAWLRSITPMLTVTAYQGTPKQRKSMSLDADFILVGVQIFKRDYARFEDHFHKKDFTFAIDEATLASNIESDNHKYCRDFSIGRPRILLSGTPINNPMDGYGLLKFTNPTAYRTQKQFENLHVLDRDFFGTPCEFQNLDVLRERLMVNSKRILYEDMYAGVEEPLFVPLNYDMEPTHQKLYKKLADEQILELENGGKIDATSANKLTHALGQIVVNWGHFSGQSADTSNAVAMIEEKLAEMGQQKLTIFVHYRLTATVLKDKLAAYGAVVINGDVTQAQKEKNLETFKGDPACRVIIIQFISGGKGLDGLQHVCHHCLFIEPCQQPRDFHQCVARLKRLGQKHRVMVMLAIAKGTLQVRGFKNLLVNDGIVNQVIRNFTDLRAAIYGN